MTPTTAHSGQQGFALVETVLALAIIAAMLGITFQMIGSVERTATETRDRRLAMLEARSVLAQVGATIPLVPGTARGASGPWFWQVEIGRDASEQPQQDIAINRVVVSVQDSASRTLARLETLRLAP